MKPEPIDAGKERRKHQRCGYDMPVEYTLSVLEFGDLQKLDLTGMGVDMSEEGMGFFTDYRLQTGHVIRIRNGDGSHRAAVVRWVVELDGRFRVGVLFYK
jgi:PilZ domain